MPSCFPGMPHSDLSNVPLGIRSYTFVVVKV